MREQCEAGVRWGMEAKLKGEEGEARDKGGGGGGERPIIVRVRVEERRRKEGSV